jgi:hypothetical protein
MLRQHSWWVHATTWIHAISHAFTKPKRWGLILAPNLVCSSGSNTMPCHPSDSNQFGLDWSRQYSVYIKDRAFTSVQYDISLNDDEWPGERTGSICVKFSWWGPRRRLDWFVGPENRSLAHTTVCCDSVVCLCPWFASYCELDKSTIPVKSAENDVHSCIRSFILGLKFTSRELKACVFQTFMRVVLKSLDIKRSNTFDTFITKKMIMDVTHARSL